MGLFDEHNESLGISDMKIWIVLISDKVPVHATMVFCLGSSMKEVKSTILFVSLCKFMDFLNSSNRRY